MQSRDQRPGGWQPEDFPRGDRHDRAATAALEIEGVDSPRLPHHPDLKGWLLKKQSAKPIGYRPERTTWP